MHDLPYYCDYQAAREQIASGDVLLFRHRGLIADYTEGPYSHAGVALWAEDRLCCGESREWRMPAVSLLSDHVARYPGCIDVYRPKCAEFVRARAAGLCVDQTGPEHAYNYAGVLRASLWRMPLLRWALAWLVTLDASDLTPASAADPKFCSQLVVWCLRQAGCDLVPGKNDAFVTPNDLGHSAALDLVFAGLTL